MAGVPGAARKWHDGMPVATTRDGCRKCCAFAPPRGSAVTPWRGRARRLVPIAAVVLAACRELALPPVSTEPVAVVGGLRFLSLSSGALHTCGVVATGATYCWGWNRDGELGDGSQTDRSTPVLVSSTVTFAAVAAGGGDTPAPAARGAAPCWGGDFCGHGGGSSARARVAPLARARGP